MKKLLIINVTANSGSTGRIAEEIGQTAISNGFDTYFAYGRLARESKCKLIKIGKKLNVRLHGIESRLFDNHGFSSRIATKRFIKEIEKIKPDIINIHNLHGYYINVKILFEYLNKTNIPIVWTFHDCWPFTGHCSYFDRYNCTKWKTECHSCPNKHGYPSSLLLSRAKRNFYKKRKLFSNYKKTTIVTPSNWLSDITKQSFFKGKNIITINNGTDLTTFKIVNGNKRLSLNLQNKKIVLGVASIWDKRKGFDDFIRLNELLSDEYKIILVGLNKKQIETLPENIIGIERTESVHELAELYSMADVFVNPTYSDNFPTTNIEALACGTPVITYKTGGSPEAIDEMTGIVVEQGNINKLKEAIESVAKDKAMYTEKCRERAVNLYNKQDRFNDYINLFNSLTK